MVVKRKDNSRTTKRFEIGRSNLMLHESNKILSPILTRQQLAGGTCPVKNKHVGRDSNHTTHKMQEY